MKASEAVALISELARAYSTFMTPAPGSRAPDTYELSHIVQAANKLAAKVADNTTDDIPF